VTRKHCVSEISGQCKARRTWPNASNPYCQAVKEEATLALQLYSFAITRASNIMVVSIEAIRPAQSRVMLRLQQHGAIVGPLDPPCITANSFVQCRSHRDICNHDPSCHSHSALKPFIPFPHDHPPSSRLDRHSPTLPREHSKVSNQARASPINPYIQPNHPPNETLPTDLVPDFPTTTTTSPQPRQWAAAVPNPNTTTNPPPGLLHQTPTHQTALHPNNNSSSSLYRQAKRGNRKESKLLRIWGF
jgi:hypothetical protein